MLVLSRRPQQRIAIDIDGRTIEIAICAIESKKVRIGIEAPPEAQVIRTELRHRPRKPQKGV